MLSARERDGIILAEQHKLDEALAAFNAIIAEEPLYSPAYNNRSVIVAKGLSTARPRAAAAWRSSTLVGSRHGRALRA